MPGSVVVNQPGVFIVDDTGNTVGVVLDGSVYRLQVEEQGFHIAQNDIVGADNYRSNITDTGYALAIDLDNPNGTYKHNPAATGLEVYSISATMIKSVIGANWEAIAGVILDIDGTSAEIAWMEFLSLHAEDTATSVVSRIRGEFPIPIDLTVVSNDLPKIAAGFIETVTEVNTGITLNDLAGNPQTPAIGDLVSRVTKNSGSGHVNLHASLWYRGI